MRNTYLTKVKFSDDSNLDYGYQETSAPTSKQLIHLYNEDGDEITQDNHTWEALTHSTFLSNNDDFWDAIESMRFLT